MRVPIQLCVSKTIVWFETTRNVSIVGKSAIAIMSTSAIPSTRANTGQSNRNCACDIKRNTMLDRSSKYTRTNIRKEATKS